MSTVRIAFLTSSRSRMSPMTTSRRPSRYSSRAPSAWARKRAAAPWRFRSEPVERLSRTRTSAPPSRSRSTRWEPMNPAPPVTRIVLMETFSEADDGRPGAPEALHRIACVDHQRGAVRDLRVVEARVAGQNQHAVGRGQHVSRGLHCRQLVGIERELRREGVGIRDMSAPAGELLDDLERRRLAYVVDIGLVRNAQDEHGSAADGTATVVEGARHEVDDVLGHGAVDLIRESDELRLVAGEPDLPREIERVDGNAVAADARSRIEGHKAEGLGRRRLDDLPGIDTDLAAGEGELVRKSDVHAAERVLEELRRLGHARVRGLEYAHRHVAVQVRRELGAALRHAADYLGNVGGGEAAVPGVDPLGREGEEDVGADHEPGRLQTRLYDLLGGAGEGRALEHEQLATMQVREQALERRHDEGDVGLLALPERSGHTDDESIGLPHLIECGGGGEPLARHQGSERLGGDIDQVRLAAIETGHALQVDVDAADREAGLGQLHRERQADIAEADNT